MADKAHNARLSAWNTQSANILNVNMRLMEAPAHERDALERAVAAEEEQLLELPAPHFTAVIRKLELLWECQLEGLDSEAEAKRLVLEDLGDLILEQSQLLGLQLPA
jgi:hypothetical protein